LKSSFFQCARHLTRLKNVDCDWTLKSYRRHFCCCFGSCTLQSFWVLCFFLSLDIMSFSPMANVFRLKICTLTKKQGILWNHHFNSGFHYNAMKKSLLLSYLICLGLSQHANFYWKYVRKKMDTTHALVCLYQCVYCVCNSSNYLVAK
jgi:hypothetical protein